jgi:hypothetical protein
MYYHDIQKSTEVQVGPPPPDNRLPYRNGQTNIEAEQGRDSPDSGRRHYPRSAPGDVRYDLPAAAPGPVLAPPTFAHQEGDRRERLQMERAEDIPHSAIPPGASL